MKKKWILIILIFIILIIISSIYGVHFIKEARKDRTWPFNSGIKLPSIIKYYAYKYTNPEFSKVKTHLYEIYLDYLAIPDRDAVGGGGAINFIDQNNLLITLNNGNNWILNLSTKNFTKGPDVFIKKFSGIRDVNIFSEKKEIALLVAQKKQNNCTYIKLKIYNFSFLNQKLEINNDKTLWESEEMCENFNPVIPNSGGRVIFYKNSYFISLGFLAENYKSGAFYSFSQDPNSSFGKIIRIFNENNYEVYSLGHRNPQGLFVRKKNDLLISTEHGPRGGDELNLITQNSNYGWPCRSIGTLYSYDIKKNSDIWPDNLKKYGCDDNKEFIEPLYSWTPSIGASQGLEYIGDEFSKMKDNLIISSLTGESLFRVILSDKNNVVNIERIRVKERIRDLIESPDGKIILYTDGGSLIILSNNYK
jgi:hypothetical protein